MNQYKHIGYYNDKEDIIDLFPNEVLKGDEGDIVVKYMKDGYGAFHSVDNDELFQEDEFDDGFKADRNIKTSDGKYIVGFSWGDWRLLAMGNEVHGFYIDIWEFVKDDDLLVQGDDLDELLAQAESLTEQLKEVVAKIQRLRAEKK